MSNIKILKYNINNIKYLTMIYNNYDFFILNKLNTFTRFWEIFIHLLIIYLIVKYTILTNSKEIIVESKYIIIYEKLFV